jgi:hypothetical protein
VVLRLSSINRIFTLNVVKHHLLSTGIHHILNFRINIIQSQICVFVAEGA